MKNPDHQIPFMGCDEVNDDSSVRMLIGTRVINGREEGGVELTDGKAYLFSTVLAELER